MAVAGAVSAPVAVAVAVMGGWGVWAARAGPPGWRWRISPAMSGNPWDLPLEISLYSLV